MKMTAGTAAFGRDAVSPFLKALFTNHVAKTGLLANDAIWNPVNEYAYGVQVAQICLPRLIHGMLIFTLLSNSP